VPRLMYEPLPWFCHNTMVWSIALMIRCTAVSPVTTSTRGEHHLVQFLTPFFMVGSNYYIPFGYLPTCIRFKCANCFSPFIPTHSAISSALIFLIARFAHLSLSASTADNCTQFTTLWQQNCNIQHCFCNVLELLEIVNRFRPATYKLFPTLCFNNILLSRNVAAVTRFYSIRLCLFHC